MIYDQHLMEASRCDGQLRYGRIEGAESLTNVSKSPQKLKIEALSVLHKNIYDSQYQA
jgi:hypothetical protein